MLNAQTKINGIIPVVGLGTWDMNGKTCVKGIQGAIELGYRHIDTAQMYRNEQDVGQGVSESGADREELFITTKIETGNLTPKRIRSSFQESLKKLRMDYVDLLLIHWPTSSMDLEACLETMFEFRDQQMVKNIGVSNFSAGLFEKSLEYGPVENNQVEFNPRQAPFDILDKVKEHGKSLTAYSPLDKGGLKSDGTIGPIAENHGKSITQVALRWLIQLGNVSVIPKSAGAGHQKENIEIFDFELTDEEMTAISDNTKRQR